MPSASCLIERVQFVFWGCDECSSVSESETSSCTLMAAELSVTVWRFSFRNGEAFPAIDLDLESLSMAFFLSAGKAAVSAFLVIGVVGGDCTWVLWLLGEGGMVRKTIIDSPESSWACGEFLSVACSLSALLLLSAVGRTECDEDCGSVRMSAWGPVCVCTVRLFFGRRSNRAGGPYHVLTGF